MPTLQSNSQLEKSSKLQIPANQTEVDFGFVLVNRSPTLTLTNAISELPETTDTSSRLKLADMVVDDDEAGTNVLGLSGLHASLFELIDSALYLRAGTTLNANELSTLSATVVVDDPSLGSGAEFALEYELTVTAAGNGLLPNAGGLVVFDPVSRQWTLSGSTGTSLEQTSNVDFKNTKWVDWQVADFNGDGLDDIAGRIDHTGAWWVSLSNGSGFEAPTRWSVWNRTIAWLDVYAGDVSGDGKADLIGRDLLTGDWSVSVTNSNGNGFEHPVRWRRWSTNQEWSDVALADFNGDGQLDLVGRVAASGSLANFSSNARRCIWLRTPQIIRRLACRSDLGRCAVCGLQWRRTRRYRRSRTRDRCLVGQF